MLNEIFLNRVKITVYKRNASFSISTFLLLVFMVISPVILAQGEITTVKDLEKEMGGREPGEFIYSGEISLKGFLPSKKNLPFWMYHNTSGRVNEQTNFLARATGRVNYNFTFANMEIGGGVVSQDGLYDQFFIDELYASFTTLSFYLTAGRKQQKELYNGLSASNRNVLWSLNARPMPGLEFGTNGPIFLSGQKGLGIEGSWNGYVMEGDRHVKYAKVHRLNALLVYRANDANFQIKTGIHHFVQWGGTSVTSGPQPGGAADYFRIIAGKEGNERAVTGDQKGVLGNHLGTYELFLQKSFDQFYLEFFYNHIFEDRSGMLFKNFPDGRYGLFLNFTGSNRIIDKVLFETMYTQNQSVRGVQTFNESDNYLNNGVYQNGWTYKNIILGAPFFEYNEKLGIVTNNKFYAHHIGISGDFSNYFSSYPYKLLLTLNRNEGSYESLGPNKNLFYWSYEMLLLQKYFDVSVQLAGEYNSLSSPIHGIGFELYKRF